MSVFKKLKNAGQSEKKMEINITPQTVHFRVDVSSLSKKDQDALKNDKLCILWKRGNHKEFGIKNSFVSSEFGLFEF